MWHVPFRHCPFAIALLWAKNTPALALQVAGLFHHSSLSLHVFSQGEVAGTVHRLFHQSPYSYRMLTGVLIALFSASLQGFVRSAGLWPLFTFCSLLAVSEPRAWCRGGGCEYIEWVKSRGKNNTVLNTYEHNIFFFSILPWGAGAVTAPNRCLHIDGAQILEAHWIAAVPFTRGEVCDKVLHFSIVLSSFGKCRNVAAIPKCCEG